MKYYNAIDQDFRKCRGMADKIVCEQIFDRTHKQVYWQLYRRLYLSIHEQVDIGIRKAALLETYSYDFSGV